MFEDKLPDDAIELGNYVTSLMAKDNNGDEKAENAVKKAKDSLKQVENISNHTNSLYLMVSDIINPPKDVQMVRYP